jgi:Protein of unknown function (DUF4232)
MSDHNGFPEFNRTPDNTGAGGNGTPGITVNPHPNRTKNIAIVGLSVVCAALLAIVAVFALQPAAPANANPPHHSPITPAPKPTPPAPTPTPAVATCSVNSLKVTLGTPEGTAGSTVYPLVFTNTGSAPCELHGFPGVSMVGDHNGTQIGAPASEITTVPITPNTIQPGHSVRAMLTVEIAQNVAGCTPMAVDGLRVYPPHSYKSIFVPAPQLVGCAQPGISLMSIQAVGAN